MQLHIPIRTWWALLALALTTYFVVQLFPIILTILLLFFAIALVSLLLNPLANKLEKSGLNRGLGVGLTLAGGVIFFVALLLLLVPLLIGTISGLTETIQAYLPQLENLITRFTDIQITGELVQSVIGFGTNFMSTLALSLGGIFGKIGEVLFAAVVVVAAVFTLVADPRTARGLMSLLMPRHYHQRIVTLTERLSTGLSRWFVAQCLICAYYTLAYGIVNVVLGVPYGLTIALIAGLLSFVPYLGGVVGLGLSLLAAATLGWVPVVIVLVTNIIIGSVDVYFVSPALYARAVEVPAAVILIGLFIGGQVGGFVAAVLTVPVVTIIVIVLRELDVLPEEPHTTEVAPQPPPPTIPPPRENT